MFESSVTELQNNKIEEVTGIKVGEFNVRGESINISQLNLLFTEAYLAGFRECKKVLDKTYEEYKDDVSSNRIGGLD